MLFFIAAGVTYVEPDNWPPFPPYGWSGRHGRGRRRLLRLHRLRRGLDDGGGSEEPAARSADWHHRVAGHLHGAVPGRGRGADRHRAGHAVPVVADALPGVADGCIRRKSTKFLNAPVAFALAVIGQDWAAYLVSAGAVAGITSVLLVMLMSQPRIFFAMSRDRLLPAGVSKVHPRFGTPYITTIITCVIVALVAGFTQIQVVGEMTSIGTLFAFVVVCAAVLVLRVKRPEAKRPFRVPFGPVFPVLGIVFVPLPDAEPAGPDLGPLPRLAEHRDGHLLVLRPAAQPAARSPPKPARRTTLEAVGNFVTVLGAAGASSTACA